jgi:chromosome segregation ATPase
MINKRMHDQVSHLCWTQWQVTDKVLSALLTHTHTHPCLQESSAQTDAAVERLQQELQQTQTQVLQLQQNLTQMHERLSSTEQRCGSTGSSCEVLHATMNDIAEQTHVLEHGLQQQQDAACLCRQQLDHQVAAVRQLSEQHMHQMQERLDQLQQKADKAATTAADGLSRCELLRQAAVLVERRVGATPVLVQQAVQPLQDR